MRLSFGLSFAACRAPVGEARDIAKHLLPKVLVGECSKRLVTSKMAHESASVSLLQKQQTKRRLGNTKLVSTHKIAILDIVFVPTSVSYTFCIRKRERRIIGIKIFNGLKANHIQLKFSNQHSFAGKRIRHNIVFTFDVLDHIGKRLNKFTPFSMPFIQLTLAL